MVLGATAVPPAGPFPASPLGAQLLASYQNGAGLLLAANMEQIVSQRVPPTNVPDPAVIAGVDNLRFVVAESKTSAASPLNTASFTFSSARHGLASWLAAPGPMGSLEFRVPPGEFRHGLCDSRPAPATLRTDRRRGTAGYRRVERISTTCRLQPSRRRGRIAGGRRDHRGRRSAAADSELEDRRRGGQPLAPGIGDRTGRGRDPAQCARKAESRSSTRL